MKELTTCVVHRGNLGTLNHRLNSEVMRNSKYDICIKEDKEINKEEIKLSNLLNFTII
jgi:proline dehydrogenase